MTFRIFYFSSVFYQLFLVFVLIVLPYEMPWKHIINLLNALWWASAYFIQSISIQASFISHINKMKERRHKRIASKDCAHALSKHTHAHIFRLWSLFSAIFIRNRQHEKKNYIFSLFLQYVVLRLFIHSFQLSDASPKEFESKQCNSSIRRHSLSCLLFACVCVCLLLLLVSRLVFILYGFLVLPMVFRLMFFFFLCPPPFPPSFIPSPLC